MAIIDQVAVALGISTWLAMVLATLFFVWVAIWKGLAFWKSARRKQIVWFIVFLVINTAGILEIIYLLIYKGKRDK